MLLLNIFDIDSTDPSNIFQLHTGYHIISSEDAVVSSGYSVTDILHQQEHQPLLYAGYTQSTDDLYRAQVNTNLFELF